MVYSDYGFYLFISLLKLYIFSIYTGTEFPFSLFVLNLAGILVLSSWTLLLKQQKRRWFLMGLLFLHSTLLISNIWYYRYFEDMLSVVLVSEINQMGSVGGGFLTLVQWYDFLFFADLLIFSAVILYLKKKGSASLDANSKQLAGSGAVLGLFLFVTPQFITYTQEGAWPGTQSVTSMQNYYHFGFWGYHGFDILSESRKFLMDGNHVTGEEEDLIEQAGLREQRSSQPAEHPNIIVVQLESFQTSVIDHEVNGQELTPNLNDLQNEMLYFPDFYHQTHEGRTSDAEFVFNTSLYPLPSGSVYPQYPANQFDGLPAVLKEIGYDTAAMHAYDKDFWNRDEVYSNIGFKEFYSEEDFPDGEVIGIALNDKDFFMNSLQFMDELDEPFYSFMVALTSHIPYEIPEDLQKLDLSGYEDPLLKGYYHTIHYVDDAVGMMVEELKQKGLWDDSLVVFYGDHDSGLTDAGGEMAESLKAETPVELFKLDRAVPLLIKIPGSSQGELVEVSGGQIDLAPTILDILGVEAPFMFGRSLFDKEDNLTVFRNGSFRYQNLFYSPDLTSPIGEGACYSIKTEKEIALTECAVHIETAAEQLRISDIIIEENALDEMSDE